MNEKETLEHIRLTGTLERTYQKLGMVNGLVDYYAETLWMALQ